MFCKQASCEIFMFAIMGKYRVIFLVMKEFLVLFLKINLKKSDFDLTKHVPKINTLLNKTVWIEKET